MKITYNHTSWKIMLYYYDNPARVTRYLFHLDHEGLYQMCKNIIEQEGLTALIGLKVHLSVYKEGILRVYVFDPDLEHAIMYDEKTIRMTMKYRYGMKEDILRPLEGDT